MLTLAPLDGLPSIRHGFFTREGGVSCGLYESMNCGFGSGDAAEAVAENRRRAAAALGLAEAPVVTPHQVHSAEAIVVEAPWAPGTAPRLDGLATRVPGLVIGVLAADCVPVLFADPEARVVGAAHAGWKGAAGGICEATVAAMQGLGAASHRIVAGIGPAIRRASYEVGPEFPERFPDGDDFFVPAPRAGHFLFDLPGYVAARLRRMGLAAVADTGLDTASEPQRCFSYRRAGREGAGDYGRMLSAIALA